MKKRLRRPAPPVPKRRAAPTPRTRKENARGVWLSQDEFATLRDSLREAKDTLEAIREGEVDAVVINSPSGSQIYSLTGADEPYRVYVERMQEGAVTISSGGVVLYANQRFAEMLLQPLNRVIGGSAVDLFTATAWSELCTLFQQHLEVVKCEVLLPRSDGTTLPVNLTASPLPLRSQNVLCVVVTDLSTLKLSEELRLGKEVAEKANLAKDTFLAALSHELRTPLTPVMAIASEAASSPELPPQVRALFGTICRNIELEARLIDDLLDVTRISHGKLVLCTGVLDGNEVLMSALSTIQADADIKSITLEVELFPQPCLIRADTIRLQQVFWNVLKNAIKFTAAHGRVKVRSEMDVPHQLYRVAISDSGIGLTAEEIKEIFEAFAQGDHAKKQSAHHFGGLGLGLAISKQIIRLHSGSIRAESDGRGKGATFIIEMPLAVEEATVASHRPESNLTVQRAEAPPGLSILLVEDHEPTRTALARLLQRRHHTVAAAATASEARGLAEAQRFDLVISDIGLPDDNGFVLMKDLKQRFNLRGIALTGYGSEDDILSSRQSGFINHLTKPVRIETLDEALAAAARELHSLQASPAADEAGAISPGMSNGSVRSQGPARTRTKRRSPDEGRDVS
jgi:PAS domain S-box-containing protein